MAPASGTPVSHLSWIVVCSVVFAWVGFAFVVVYTMFGCLVHTFALYLLLEAGNMDLSRKKSLHGCYSLGEAVKVFKRKWPHPPGLSVSAIAAAPPPRSSGEIRWRCRGSQGGEGRGVRTGLSARKNGSSGGFSRNSFRICISSNESRPSNTDRTVKTNPTLDGIWVTVHPACLLFPPLRPRQFTGAGAGGIRRAVSGGPNPRSRVEC